MKNYRCERCGMEIKPLVCAQCDMPMVEKIVQKDGEKVNVVECPHCHGKVKSPQCCGHDMKTT